MAPSRTRFTLRIVDIKGLYTPEHPAIPSGPGESARAASYQPGYKSQDNRGRIYINHDLDGCWKNDTQLIEVTAEITAEGELPADAKLRWTVRDPDDPSDEQTGVASYWGSTLDRNDFDAKGEYLGPMPDDNEGSRDGHAPWEEVSGFALSDAKETCVRTAIVGMKSKIRHRLTDVAGDNLILRVDLDTAEPVEGEGDETGIMTLWHRIDVEYIRMQSAQPLPVDGVPSHFEPAFAQLDFAAERVIPDMQYMAPDSEALGEVSSRFMAENFTHARDSGWFCLISALEPHPLPDVRGEVLFKGMATIVDAGEGMERWEYIEIPGRHTNADLVRFTWEAQSVSFSVAKAIVLEGPPVVTQLWLEPHDVQDRFTAGDGSLAHAYEWRILFFPRGRLLGAIWEPPGYGVPEHVAVEVQSAGAFYTAGISPTIDIGHHSYFAGRTIVFSHHGAWWDRARGEPKPEARYGLLHTIVHELVHGFGMPHKCGYFDYRAPLKGTCCMNYGPNWMIGADEQLIQGTAWMAGDDMCGRHLHEIRRVHLEKNKGLRWK